MAMGKQRWQRQQEFGVAAAEMPSAPGHPFYRKLNSLLAEQGFDEFVEGLCAKFYHDKLGRPSIPARRVLPDAADRVLRRDRL